MLRNLLRKIKRRWAGSDFAESVAVLASGTAAAQAISLVAAPLLTRLYTAADFGLFAVFASILSLLTVVATLRYKLAIPLPDQDGTAANVLGLSVLVAAGLSLVVSAAVFTVGPALLRLTNTAQIEPYLWLLPVGVVGVGVYQGFNYWAVRRGGFGSIARTKLTQAVAKVATQLGLGLRSSGPFGLIAGKILGEVTGSGALIRWGWRNDRQHLLDVSWTGIKEVAVRYRRFPLYSSGSAICNRGGIELPALMLASLYGPDVAGWYAVSQRVVGAPLGMLGNAVAEVYIGKAPRLARDNPSELRRLFQKTTVRLMAIGAVPVGLVVVGGPELFEFVFGQGWAKVGVYIRLLAVMFLSQFVVSPVSQTLNILERQDLQLVWDVLRLVFVAAALGVPYALGLGDEWAIGSFGVVMLTTYVLLYVLSRSVLPESADEQA